MQEKTLVVNGFERKLIIEPEAMLSEVLRDQLHLTGTKVGCGQGQCGAGPVIVDGKVVRACIIKARRLADHASVTTIEGLGTPANLHPLQVAWVVHGGAQCGFCTPGFIFGSRAPRPTGVATVTGQWLFGDDQKHMLPQGTLHLAIVEAKVSHAILKGVDTAAALAMPGVPSVITAKDVKGKNRITGLITFPSNKGDGWDRPILCDEKVFQYGDAIALVAADSERNARAAAEKVTVDLEVLPAYMDAPSAMAADALGIHPGTPNVYYEQNHAKGDEVRIRRLPAYPEKVLAGLQALGT